MLARRSIIAAALALAAPLALAQTSAEPEQTAHTVAYRQQQAPSTPPASPETKPVKQPLAGTHWTLTQLNGQAVSTDPNNKEAYIELDPNTQRLSGSGGCNRLMGSYELDGSSLRFKQVASTMMACKGDAMTSEQSFIKALSDAASYRIHGSTLLLRDKENTVIARFEAHAESKP
jgi:heat shock protein HslJ